MFLRGRICSECGSSLVCKSPRYSQPYCFVCGFNCPEVKFPSKGWVWEILPKINFNFAMYGGKATMLPPAVTFINGYAFLTESLFDALVEDRWETLATREPIEHDRGKVKSRAKEVSDRSPE